VSPAARQGGTSGARQRVVIVGSGFAGFECARKLARTLRRHDNTTEVVLISPNDYMLYTSLLPDVAGGLVDPRFVAIPLAESLPGVRLITGRVDRVDLSAATVTISASGLADQHMSYDRLVLTPGSVTRLFDIPGLAEHARGLKTIAEAMYLRDHLLHELELSTDDPDATRQQARRTVVVVGASYAGTELVAQLRALADTTAAHHRFDPRLVRFVLLDLAEQVMPELGTQLGDRAMGVLQRLGVDVRLGHTLSEVREDGVTVDDGSVIGTHTVAWVTGVTASPLIATLDLPTEKGRLRVYPDLSVPAHPHVFAAGDAAAVPDLTKPGRVTPPTAQHATRQGSALARNVAASLGVGTARPYKHRDLGLVVDLGPHHAVADPLGAHLSGYPAKLVTRGYHLFAVPKAANRWALGMSYLTSLLTDRPVVRLDLVGERASSFAGSEGDPGRS